MKSAYELAMERMGGTHEYSDQKKKQFAEIDSRYDSQEAQAKLQADERLHKEDGDPDEIKQELAHDLARLRTKREAEKNKIRDSE